jgi:imidazole glycerol-phosphate synthase subunit HisF
LVRKIFKIDIKNDHVVKGRQLEGVRKILKLQNLRDHFPNLDATEILLVDYTKSNFGLEPNYEAVELVASQFNLPITYGGGIFSIEQIRRLASVGASRFYLNSMLYRHNARELMDQFCAEVGRQSIVVGIEYRLVGSTRVPYFNAGRDIFNKDFNRHLNFVLDIDVGELIFTCINNDGMKTGLDHSIINQLSHIKKIPKIIAGGATDFDYDVQFDGCAISTLYLESINND